MSANYFLDTNIFVYSFHDQDQEKQAKARKLISRSLSSEDGMISTQVIQEFINVALHKFRTPMHEVDCKEYVRHVMDPLCEVYPNSDLYCLAIDIKATTQFGFYDSLIIAAAIKGNCSQLYTEDLQHGQKIRGLHIINPFA